MKPLLTSSWRKCVLVALISLPISLFAQQTSVGNDFWLVFNETFPEELNVNPPQLLELQVFISSEVGATGLVEIEGIAFSEEFNVPAGDLITVTVPDNAFMVGSDIVEDLGVHVTADNPISVYGLNQRAFSSDAYLAIPTSAWTTDYLVMSYANSGAFVGSQFGIVSSSDNNLVIITPTAEIGGEPAGVPYQVTLNEGEVYQGRSGAGSDLTGTAVQSSAPVGVFGSHYCANVPISLGFCDHLTEMLPPSNSWGKFFVTVPFADRLNGDIFRILASEDGTIVEINGVPEATLNRGEFFETVLTAASSIESSAPVLLAQFMQGNEDVGPQFVGDPSMMIIPPREQFLGDYTVSTPATGFDSNYLNLVVDGNGLGMISLNGLPIPASQFSAIPGTNFNSAQLEVDLGTYTLTSNTAFGVFVYGTNNEDSYAYPGGQVYSDVIAVNNLTLTPPSSEAHVLSELCFQATLTSDTGEPLEGVRIDFTVQGANQVSGFVFTDENGGATICYSGQNEGADLLTAFQGGLSQEVAVLWTEVESCSNYRYFLADNPTGGGDSKLFEYTLNENDQVAELNELLSLPYAFHIAYDGNANLVYIVRSSNGNFRTLDVSSNGGDLSEEVILSQTLGGAVAAGFDTEGVLHIGSDVNNAIYTVDKELGLVEFFRNAPVHGGDLAFADNGNLYLATRDFGGRTIELNTLGQIAAVQNLPALVTGFAISESGFGLVSIKNRNRIYLGDFEGNLLNSYLLLLNGEPFMKGNGDMASGCDGSFQGGECPNFLTYYTGYSENNTDNELYGITLGEDNSVELTLIEGFSAEDNHIALSPEGLIYAVREDKIDIFDPASGAYVQENIPIQTTSGQSLNGFPAATFDLNGVLFLGRPSDNTVYSIDFVGGIAEASVAFSDLGISGGDLIATGTPDDQILWLVNRAQSTLTNLLDNTVVDLELDEVNGACLLEDGRLLLANGSTSETGGLYAVDLLDFSTQMLSITGGPEVFFNGDLASGCPSSVAALTEFVSAGSNFERELVVMPNPSQGMTTVVFAALENEIITIEVLDMSGRAVVTLINRTSQTAGEQRVIFDGSRLTNGIYLVRMTSNEFQKVERLVISR